MNPLARLVEQTRIVKEEMKQQPPVYSEQLKQDLVDFKAESLEILKITMISLMRNLTYSLSTQCEKLANLHFHVNENGLSIIEPVDSYGEPIPELEMQKASASVWLDQQLLQAFNPNEISEFLDGARVNASGQVFLKNDSKPVKAHTGYGQ